MKKYQLVLNCIGSILLVFSCANLEQPTAKNRDKTRDKKKNENPIVLLTQESPCVKAVFVYYNGKVYKSLGEDDSRDEARHYCESHVNADCLIKAYAFFNGPLYKNLDEEAAFVETENYCMLNNEGDCLINSFEYLFSNNPQKLKRETVLKNAENICRRP
jgi:cytoplasmic iron level regulating protein YaaA (DUF328/UPF0246 family)